MGKPTGFMEYERKNCVALSPKERLQNYEEFHKPLKEEERKTQAARCMNCGVPFCQSGMTLGGMTTGCPLHNLIPEWNDELYRGNLSGAAERLIKTNPFPEFTGRVCPALCETACTCNLIGAPVTVRDNELFIIEKAWERGAMVPQIPSVKTGKKVAIVGAGPAGLATAEYLHLRGHSVVVYEREAHAGGLLYYGIPNMKLDKSVVLRRVEKMQKEGVEFVFQKDVGKDVTKDELQEKFDLIVLATGSKKARDIAVKGREADGILFAVDYLSKATQSVTEQKPLLSKFDAKHKNVIIVGGGDTGNDCLGTALRQGAKSVVQLEMMQEPPLNRSANNPWPEWAKVKKTDYGQEEAIAVFHKDPRLYQTTVKEIKKGERGEIVSVVIQKVEPKKDENGKTTWGGVSGSEKELPCDLLLIAAGFIGAEDYVVEAFGLQTTARGTIAEQDYKTAKEKVLVCGDAKRGQSLVVWAIAEGMACAKKADELLMGYTNLS